jgi:hypothetical protein
LTGSVLASLISGALSTANIPSLPTSKITSGTFLSSILPMFGLSQSAGTNLVLDPSFENASAWYSTAQGSQSTDQALSGNYSWMFEGLGGTSYVSLTLLSNDVAPFTVHTSAGEIFQTQINVYPKVGNAGGGDVLLRLVYTDSTGTLGSTYVNVVNVATPATGAWTLLSGHATVPAGYDTVQFQFFWNGPTTDYIYIDDALLREETLAQSTIAALFSGGTVGSTILAAAVPALDASKITTGSLTGATVPGSQLTGSVLASLISGALSTANIPSIAATKVTSGTFPSGVTFPAAQLGTGAVPSGVTLPGSQLTGSVLASLISGTLSTANIPTGIPATSIAEVLGGTDLGADLTTAVSNIANSLTGSTGTQTQAAAATALANNAATTAANSAAIAAMQTVTSGSTNGGTSVVVNFLQCAKHFHRKLLRQRCGHNGHHVWLCRMASLGFYRSRCHRPLQRRGHYHRLPVSLGHLPHVHGHPWYIRHALQLSVRAHERRCHHLRLRRNRL